MGPYVNNQGLANCGVRSGHASAAWIHNPLQVVHQEICSGNNTNIRPAEESRNIQDT